MLRSYEYEHVARAITELAKEGRETAPPPGVVWARADAIAREARPRLSEPDPSPADLQRSRERFREIVRQIDETAQRRSLNPDPRGGH